MIFVDSSALVKRYIEEPGSDKIDALLDGARKILVSRLAYAETLSALVRRRKVLDFSDEEFDHVIAEFRSDWERFTVLEMNDEALQHLDRVIERHTLKGADSIHLSTALWIKQTSAANLTFVASDKELLSAARNERFKTVNPQDFSSQDMLRQ